MVVSMVCYASLGSKKINTVQRLQYCYITFTILLYQYCYITSDFVDDRDLKRQARAIYSRGNCS